MKFVHNDQHSQRLLARRITIAGLALFFFGSMLEALLRDNLEYAYFRITLTAIAALFCIYFTSFSHIDDKARAVVVPLILIVCEICISLTTGGVPLFFGIVSACFALSALYLYPKSLMLLIVLYDVTIIVLELMLGIKIHSHHLDDLQRVMQIIVENVFFLTLLAVDFYSSILLRAARQGNMLFETVMTTTYSYTLLTDKHSRVMYISDTLLKSQHLKDAKQAIGYPVADLFEQAQAKILFNRLATAEGVQKEQFSMMQDGEEKWYSIQSGPFMGGGEGRYFEWYDVTPIMKAAKAAEDATKTKSMFLANMSHEIRTPMNAILGMAELLSADRTLSQEQKKYIRDIRVSSSSLLDIINDILDFSKIEANKLSLVNVDYSFPALLENLESLFTFVSEPKGIRFRLKIVGDIPEVLFGDDIRLKQVFTNLIGNAVKFTTKGCVTLRVEQKGDNLHIDISDTGIGIKSEDISRLFGVFEQVNEGETRVIKGTGLGLSITKDLLGLMNATISVESEFGVGTIFHVVLPIVLGDKSKLIKISPSRVHVHAPSAKVLVVDDNEINLNVANGHLKTHSIFCDRATSAKQAFKMIAETKYDIVFMDHLMPEIDGIEATAYLRNNGYADLVIIALTANAVSGMREMFLANGFSDYMSKPIESQVLNDKLFAWLPQELRGNAVPSEKKEPTPSAILAKTTTEPPLSAPTATPAASGKKLFTDFLAGVDEVDVEQGMVFNMNSQDFYFEMVDMISANIPSAIENLIAFLASDNLKDFGILIHSEKSTLLSIGCAGLSAEAKELEFAAKDNNLAFCKEKFPAFLEKYSAFSNRLTGAVSEFKATRDAN